MSLRRNSILRASNRGYLLLEALVSLSLLTVGLLACSESFSLAHRAAQQSSEDALLARCAAKKFFEQALQVPVSELACPSDVAWSENLTALTPRLQKQVWTAAWKGNDQDRFELIEVIRAN